MAEKEEHKTEEHSHKEKKVNWVEKARENPWMVSTVVLAVIFFAFFINTLVGTGGASVSGDFAGQRVLDLANAQVGGNISLTNVEEESGLYKVNLMMEGREVPIYVTLDGENLVSGLTPFSVLEEMDTSDTQDTQPAEVAKSNRPVVELFVMTHCPYGTQAEKGIIPTIKAMSSTADFKIRFVHYFMHGDKEEAETYTQLCIREEQADKYLTYLECFLEDSNTSRCLKETAIATNKLETCLSNGKAEEYYAEDSALSESYGVRGSPTLVINGAQATSGRDSVSYFNTVCDAFTTEPSVCGKDVSTLDLSSATPSPGFGWEGSASSSTSAQC